MKILKKWLALLLCAALMISLFSGSMIYAHEEEYEESGETEEDFEDIEEPGASEEDFEEPTEPEEVENSYVLYPIEGGELCFDPLTGTVVGCTGFPTVADIPEQIEGTAVTAVGNSAFYDCYDLKEVSIPGSVLSIGDYAFSYCANLEKLSFAEGLRSIGDSAFYGCAALTEVEIPGTVTEIKEMAFSCCGKLTVIRVREENSAYCTDSAGALFNKEMTALLQCPGGFEGAYDVPQSVTVIHNYAFMRCEKLTAVTLPESLTTIGISVFNGCSELTGITIPQSVTDIGDYGFCNCTSMTYADIQGPVETIGERLFYACSQLKEVSIPDSVKTVGSESFYECEELTQILLPEGITTIGESAFRGCVKLENVTLPQTLTELWGYSFFGCESLKEITVPENVTYMGSRVFALCSSLTEIRVEEENPVYSSDEYGVLYNKDKTHLLQYPGKGPERYSIAETASRIGDYAFACTYDLKWVEIPGGVTVIGGHAFASCSALTSLTIPEGVTEIYADMIKDCESLTHVHFPGDMPEIYGELSYDEGEGPVFCYREGKENWENCEFHTAVWEYTLTLGCGVATYTCNTCGDTHTLQNEDAHPWDGGRELAAPTCTEKGKLLLTCTQCDTTKEATIPATGHSQGEQISETDLGWEYACLNGEHTYFVYKDQRVNAMYLEDVSVTFIDEENYPWIYGQNNEEREQSVIRSSNGGVSDSISATTIYFTCDREMMLSFTYGVSSEEGYDELTILLDGVAVVNAVSGVMEGTYTSDVLTEGTHTLALLYSKDGAADSEEDQAYLYGIEAIAVGEKPEVQDTAQDLTLKLNHTLNLASDISINYLIPKTLMEGYDMSTVYLESLIENYAGNAFVGTERVITYPVENGNYYYFTLTGLTAVNMNNNIDSVIRGVKDGQERYSPTDRYSIATYAHSQMNNPNRPNSLKTLCADLLRYGAKAQVFKAYRTDALADGAMTEEHRAYLSNLDAVIFGQTNRVLNDLPNAPISWTGKALNLESKVCLKFVFDIGNYAGDPTALTLRISYKDINGAEKTAVIEKVEEYNTDFNLYAFTVDILLAAELRTVVSAQIFAGETPVSATLQYCADAYGNNKTGVLLDLCKALIAYSDSAKAFFKN